MEKDLREMEIGVDELEEMDEMENELELEEEEEVLCTCRFCGEDFELDSEEDGDDEICWECLASIDSAYNGDLVAELANYFNTAPKYIVEHEPIQFDIDGKDYLVYHESEIDDVVQERVEETLWAFNPDFLASMTGIDSLVFEAIQDNHRCEGNNDAILSIVEKTCGIEEFTQEAITWDGRGHLMNSYDGEEHEILVGSDYYLAYRI